MVGNKKPNFMNFGFSAEVLLFND